MNSFLTLAFQFSEPLFYHSNAFEPQEFFFFQCSVTQKDSVLQDFVPLSVFGQSQRIVEPNFEHELMKVQFLI